MISVIVVTHGALAQEFVKATEHVLGPKEHFHAFSIFPEDDVEQRRKDLMRLVEAQPKQVLKKYVGTIVLTDMFGGTPSNLSLTLLDHKNVEVIAGVNLPMLIKLISIREKTNLKDAADQSQDAGRQYMNVARQFLEKSA